MTGLHLESPALDVFGQMAADEALARSHPGAFCLRFYRWRGPGTTFGYAQRIREVEKKLPPEMKAVCTRRPTGGGIVPHVDDLTFSCVFPAEGVLRPAAHYRRLHSALQAALDGDGWVTQLSGAEGGHAPQGPGGASQCFQRPVALDILADGNKILGGALRRYGDTVLYQGSLQRPGIRARAAKLEAAFREHLGLEWELAWENAEPDPAVQAAAAALEEQYRSPEWIRKI